MFKKISSIQVIDSIAEITRYQDKEILERSLITTLGGLLNHPELCLYRIINDLETRDEAEAEEEDLELLLVIHYKNNAIVSHEELKFQVNEKIEEGIKEVIETGEISTLKDEANNHYLFVYPVFDKDNKVTSILTQETEDLRFQDQRLAYGFLQIYSNYLLLIEDNQKDKLTNLLNRETLDREIYSVITRNNYQSGDNASSVTKRRKHDDFEYWLVLIDIDFFKEVNDKFGHLIGDETLLLFARLLTDVFRQDDKIFRYGGEEFVVLLKTQNQRDLKSILERLRLLIEGFVFPQVGTITASLGAVKITDQQTPSCALGHADTALYHAKTHGRNQIILYEDLISQGLVKEDKNEIVDIIEIL